MKNKLFCPECFNDEEFKKIKDYETHEIRGEKYKNKVTKYICNNCGQDIIDDDEYDKSLIKAFNKYRKEHNLLFPEEIKQIREMYGLSQRGMSRLLGWGQVTINRYEKGALQDEAHNQMLMSFKKPEFMLELLEKNKDNISDKNYEKTKNKANKLIQKSSIIDTVIIKKMQSLEKEYKGDQEFDIEKFLNMILFFAQNIKKLWQTKLFKLLFYSEFFNYKKYKKSISGTAFVHWQHGPVPKHIYGLLEILTEDYKLIEAKETQEYNYIGETIINNKDFDESLFSPEELESLNYVLNKFKNYTSTEIRNLSHKEKGYKETIQNQLISYNYANDLQI